MWSAIGFNLLIVCISIEWFFLYNFFWTKTRIAATDFNQTNPDRGFAQGLTYNNIFLWNQDYTQAQVTSNNIYFPAAATLSVALKAALANCVAFSSILGKAGPLEAFLVSFIGTFGFELCRNVLELLDIEPGFGFSIFSYGGFMGFFMGLMLNCKYKGERTTAKNFWYTGSSFSGALSFFGACILFALFPILAMDNFLFDRSQALHTIYTIPLSIWYSISASVVVSLAGSILVHGKAIGRDMINGVVSGGVASLTASYYFTNPVWPMVLGSAAGIAQLVGQSFVETKWAQKKSIINTYSFTVFGVQAIVGGVFASIFRAAVETRTDGFTFTLDNIRTGGWSLLLVVIAAGIGIIFGLLIGVFVLIAGKHRRYQHFHDYTYWVPDDGIRYDIK